MNAAPKGLLDRALGYLLGFSALAVVLVAVVIALPLSALASVFGMAAIIVVLDGLGIGGEGISTTLSMLALIAIPVLTFLVVVWVYRRIPKRLRASLEDPVEKPAKRGSRSRDELWREVTELDARFATPQRPTER